MAPPPQAPFNVSVVRRSLKFYLAVFFIFAPMMLLSVTSSAEGHSTGAILTWFILSGGIAAIADLESDAFPLGVMADTGYAVRELQMSAGDTLVLYTDGLTEVFDDHGEQLGIEGWRQLVARSPIARLDRDLGGLFDRARATGQGPQLDDQSVILIRAS